MSTRATATMVAPVVHAICPCARSITATTGLPGTSWPLAVIFSPSVRHAHTPSTAAAMRPMVASAIVGPGSRVCDFLATSLPAMTAPWCGCSRVVYSPTDLYW